jgi:hypothetical protein
MKRKTNEKVNTQQDGLTGEAVMSKVAYKPISMMLEYYAPANQRKIRRALRKALERIGREVA